MLGHDVLRRPRALRLPGPRLRALRARERAAARHVPEHDEVRGRDHRDDARPAARRRGRPTANPVGLVTSGGSGSILHAVLAYREHAQQTRGIERPNFVKPETGAPRVRQGVPSARRRAAARADRSRRRRSPTSTRWRTLIDENTIAIVGSACNYGYGTIDPIAELSDLALERGVGLHVDGCLGGFILPWGQELGYDIPVFDFRIPGVTTISADTHKYGYGFKGTSVLAFRDKRAAQQPVLLHDRLDGRQVRVARHRRFAFRRDARGDVGRDGEHRAATATSSTPSAIFETAFAMQDAVRSHPELRIIGQRRRSASASRATTSTSTTSTTSCGRGAGASTASSTRTRSTWRSPGRRPNRAWSRRSPPTSPRRSPYALEHKDEKPDERRDLRRRRGRA